MRFDCSYKIFNIASGLDIMERMNQTIAVIQTVTLHSKIILSYGDIVVSVLR